MRLEVMDAVYRGYEVVVLFGVEIWCELYIS